jgi:hypothetical protein
MSPSIIVRALVSPGFAIILAATTVPAGAQVVRETPDAAIARGTVTLIGTVRDAAERPVAGAELRVGERRTALSDSSGHFTLPGVPFGPVELLVRRIGFERGVVKVAPTQPGVRVELTVQLAEAPFRLPSVLVEGRAYDKGLWDVGFYKRERVGYGKYFDPDFMQHYGGASLASLVREVPRVHVERYNDQEYAYGRIAGNACRMNIYVDGVFRREAMSGMGGMDKGVGLNLLVPKEEIYAVEVYPTINSLPAEYTRVGPRAGRNAQPTARIPLPGNMHDTPRGRPDEEIINNDAACGAVVIWTKWGLAGRVA